MRARILALILVAPLLPACMSGILYTHTIEPLTTNFTRAPVQKDATGRADGDVHHIHVPLTRVDLDVIWNSNALGDVAQRNGLSEIYYADLETFSILTIWNQYTAHVYGKRAPEPPAPATPPVPPK